MDFTEQLRARTRYPVMRSVVQLWIAVAYLVAGGLVLFAIITALQGSAEALMAAFLCVVGAAVVVLIGHLVREMAVMLADIADGVLHVAERHGPTDSSPRAADANQDG